MSSAAENESSASVPSASPAQAQPRLQRNALSLFETISATLANLVPAVGYTPIWVSLRWYMECSPNTLQRWVSPSSNYEVVQASSSAF